MKNLGVICVTALLLVTMAGCSLSKHDDTPSATSTSAATAAPAPATVTGLDPAASQTITDGICRALVPEDWILNGNGGGTAPSGARFTLFGNKISSDVIWSASVNIVATIAAGQGAKAQQTADSISFVRADGSSFETRRRIGDRYCDFSVTSSKPAPENERAIWPAIAASMTAAPGAP